jgi:Tfp pilus assembly protein FimV
MSPQLRESLRDAAKDAGCSLNAFAVQVLAAAAGDAARFRGTPDSDVRAEAVRPAQEWRSRAARNDFINAMRAEMGSVAMAALVQRLDVEDPGYFLEWWQNPRPA